jgi:bacillithiol biosynthesis deacetylase BshB1
MKILVFGIHPDDIELGCGGTVALCATRGHDVVLVDLTRGESSSNGTPEGRALEAEEAARLLGSGARENLELPDTGLVAGDPGQQRAVAGAIRKHRPGLVVLPSKDDPHPDHSAGGETIERAMYLAGIHGYPTVGRETAWRVTNALVYPGRRELDPDVIVDVSGTFETKLGAIRAHHSQFGDFDGATETPLNRPGFLAAVEARAVAAGYKIGVRFGEGFRLLNPVAAVDPVDLFQGLK